MILALGGRGLGSESRTTPILTLGRSETTYVVNIVISEGWQAYQRRDQIQLETVASPIRLGGVERWLIRKNKKKNNAFNLQTGDRISMKFDI